MKIPHPEKSGFGMTGHFRGKEEGKSGELSEIAGFVAFFFSSPLFPSPFDPLNNVIPIRRQAERDLNVMNTKLLKISILPRF
jgi:hypothetical protein